MPPIKPIVFLSLSLVLLSSCDIFFPPKEVQGALSFETSGAPRLERHMQQFVNQFNHALMEQAIGDGSRTTLQMKDDSPNEKADWPDTPDMVLLPLFTRAALEKAANPSSGVGPRVQPALSPEVLDKIDFNSQFALLVAHPAQVYAKSGFDFSGPYEMSAHYFDTLLVKYSSADILRVQLKTRRLGNPPLFPTKWKSNVFLFDRKDYKRLELQWGEDTYNHDILSATETIKNKK